MAAYTVWIREVQAVPVKVEAENVHDAVNSVWMGSFEANYNRAVWCNRLDSKTWSVDLPDGREIYCDNLDNFVEGDSNE